MEWFRSIVMIDISKINCEHFSRKQAEAARTLLLGLVKEYDKRVESIKEHDNIDPDKLDALKKEIIVECERMALPLQRKKMDGEDVEQIEVYRIGYSTGCARPENTACITSSSWRRNRPSWLWEPEASPRESSPTEESSGVTM